MKEKPFLDLPKCNNRNQTQEGSPQRINSVAAILADQETKKAKSYQPSQAGYSLC